MSNLSISCSLFPSHTVQLLFLDVQFQSSIYLFNMFSLYSIFLNIWNTVMTISLSLSTSSVICVIYDFVLLCFLLFLWIYLFFPYYGSLFPASLYTWCFCLFVCFTASVTSNNKHGDLKTTLLSYSTVGQKTSLVSVKMSSGSYSFLETPCSVFLLTSWPFLTSFF